MMGILKGLEVNGSKYWTRYANILDEFEQAQYLFKDITIGSRTFLKQCVPDKTKPRIIDVLS